MNLLALARAAKVCALVGFLLPWVVVSCSGQAVESATGVDLARGHGGPNVFIILAMATIVGALMFSLYPREASIRARTVLVGAILAAVLVCAGVGKTWLDWRAHEAGQAGAEAVRFETRFGLWLTLASLLAAAGLSGAALRRGGDRP